MSVWTTKTTNRTGEFVVLKHSIPGINYNIKGVRFRDGFAVVEKGSKMYNQLKKMPQLTNSPEYHLLYLGKLKFITRSLDIKTVYGNDIYVRYLKAIEHSKTEEFKIEQEVIEEEKKVVEEVHLADHTKCQFRLSNGNLCKNDAEQLSPSDYCTVHLLDDKSLKDFGIIVPMAIPKNQRKQLRDKVLSKLNKYFKEEAKSKNG